MEPGKELTIIENSIEVFRSGGQILTTHKMRSEKAIAVAGSIVRQWEEVNSIEDPEERMKQSAELDARSNKFLSNCSVAKAEMMESRKAITQLMDTIKAAFTEKENKLDVKKSELPAKVQSHRNAYAKWVLDETERKRVAAEKKAARETEANELNAKWKLEISQFLLNILSDKKEKVMASFNAITLENFETKSEGLAKMQTECPVIPLAEIQIQTGFYKHHTREEIESLLFAAKDAYDYESFYKDYKMQISLLKHDLIGKLESKKAELEEAERLRLEAEAAEAKRRAEMEKAKSEKERVELEKKQAEAREEEQRRMEKLEEEKRAREEEESRKLAEEQERLRKEAELKIETEKAAKNAATLFEQVAATASPESQPPATKQGFIITVLHTAGWVELFSFWYGKEGVKLPLPDLEKKTLKQIKTFCEKAAKDGEMIESKFLRYDADVKAINKKEKV